MPKWDPHSDTHTQKKKKGGVQFKAFFIFFFLSSSSSSVHQWQMKFRAVPDPIPIVTFISILLLLLSHLIPLVFPTTPQSPDPIRIRIAKQEMSWYLKGLLYGVGGIAVVGLAALVALQEKMVYVPSLPGLPRSYPITPARLHLDYEDVWLTSQDGVRLHSWFIKHSPSVRG